MSEFRQHCKYIAWCSTRICLKKRIPVLGIPCHYPCEFIGIIVPNLYLHYYSEMLAQFLSSYRDYHYKFLVFASNHGAEEEQQYIEYPDQKKGIFLANDTYANMFLNLIFQKYGTFPSTYEIVGFDDSPIASEAILPITTVGQQIDVIAKTAMDLLVRQMDEQKKRAPKPLGEPIHKQITPILIRRNTTQ